jgi:uncharacterized membrane protein
MFDVGSMTEILARIIGLYMVSAGIGLVIDPKIYDGIIENMRDNPALAYVTAVLVFSIGAVLVTLHNQWTGWQAILVSLMGWGALVEGVLMLAVRRIFFAIVAKFPMTMTVYRVAGGFAVFLGAALLYAGVTV